MLDLLDSIDRRTKRIEKWLPKTKGPQSKSTKPSGLLEFIPRVSPKYTAAKHLRPIADLFERIVLKNEQVFAVVSMPPRHGKAVACDTPMLSRRGWLTAGDVVVGDELTGSDGQWTKVLAVYPQGHVQLFRVTFSDGASVRTCAEHRWQAHQRYSGRARLLTTGQLSQDLLESDGRKKWRIPVVAPLALGGGAPLPIEPYLFGCWLGDGSSYKGEITSADGDVVEAIRAAGFATSYEYDAGAAKTYGIPGLWSKLRRLGVIGCKHIPAEYLSASAPDRLAVLQGLADTDGTVAKDGSQQSICTTSERLAVDIKFLINSLGGVWTECTRRAAGKIAHNIYFRLPGGTPGFRLARKAQRLCVASRRNDPRRFIRSIEPCDAGEAVCFTVESADGLFCAGRELVVTHNTECELHGLAWALSIRPELQLAFASYAGRFAEKKSRKARGLALKAGLPLAADAQSRQDWRTGVDDGGVWATSIGGQLTGEGFHLLLVDDPHKGRAEAESSARREDVWEWFNDDALSRLEPSGSCIVTATRWHTDDLIGRLVSRGGWEVVNLPAINDGSDPSRAVGEALWPERYTAERLRQIQEAVGEYTWASLYQGQPRPRGASVFRDAHYYSALPINGRRYCIGFDLAYTSKTYSDYSVAVVTLECDGVFYVVDVVRVQAEAPAFGERLKALQDRYNGARTCGYVGGTELGVVDFLRANGLSIDTFPAKTDKFVRAQPVAAAWNAGKLLLPESHPEWLDPFLSEVCGFTGVKDSHDDQVDALAGAFDGLAMAKPIDWEFYDSIASSGPSAISW